MVFKEKILYHQVIAQGCFVKIYLRTVALVYVFILILVQRGLLLGRHEVGVRGTRTVDTVLIVHDFKRDAH